MTMIVWHIDMLATIHRKNLLDAQNVTINSSLWWWLFFYTAGSSYILLLYFSQGIVFRQDSNILCFQIVCCNLFLLNNLDGWFWSHWWFPLEYFFCCCLVPPFFLISPGIFLVVVYVGGEHHPPPSLPAQPPSPDCDAVSTNLTPPPPLSAYNAPTYNLHTLFCRPP